MPTKFAMAARGYGLQPGEELTKGRAALGAVAGDSNMQRRVGNQVKLGAAVLGAGLAAPAILGGAGAGAAGAGTAASTAGPAGTGAAGAGGVMGGISKALPIIGQIGGALKGIGGFGMENIDGILAAGAGVEGALAMREAGRLRDTALDRARSEYGERAPLRQMAITGLQNETPEDLSALFADPGNAYYRAPQPRPAPPVAGLPPGAPAGPSRLPGASPWAGPKAPGAPKSPLPVAGWPTGASSPRRV